MTTGRIEAGINDVYVLGTVEEQPVFIHNERGYGIHEGVLAVPRRSGEIDYTKKYEPVDFHDEPLAPNWI